MTEGAALPEDVVKYLLELAEGNVFGLCDLGTARRLLHKYRPDLGVKQTGGIRSVFYPMDEVSGL